MKTAILAIRSGIFLFALSFIFVFSSCKKDAEVEPENTVTTTQTSKSDTIKTPVSNTGTGATGTPATGTPATGTPATGATGTTGTTGSGSTKPATGSGTTTGTTTGVTTGTATPGSGNGAKASYTTSPAMVLNNRHDVVISYVATPSITLNNCQNITIRNCKIGPNKLTGIQTYQCTNIKIDSCYIANVSTGVYAVDSQTISVTNCEELNMQGPYPKGAFVQFDNVSGGGCQVSHNKFQNILGQSYPEDAISMYKSNGLANDPIVIDGNWIRGGGPSQTGGGIMLGDNGGSNIVAKNNILVDPGQYGMAVSGGINMSIINNSIYAKVQSFTNVGLYYWNQSGLPSSNVTISGNKVNFTSEKYGVNNTFLGSGNTTPIGWSTNILSAKIDESLLPSSIVAQ